MAERKMDIAISPQSIFYISLCVAVILIFLIGGILPARVTLEDLEEDASAIQYRIEEQKTLAPLYQSLLASSSKKESTLLPRPEKGKLPKERIRTLPASIGAACKMSGMSLVSVIPNVGALTGDARVIPVDVILRGNFINFRKFLINLGGIPYVDHIEEIAIQAKPDAREYRLKLWVAVG